MYTKIQQEMKQKINIIQNEGVAFATPFFAF